MKKIASKSTHHRYNHATLIFAGSRLLVVGYNNKDHHAEIVALRRLEALLRNGNTRRPRNLHLVNIMIKKKSGNLGDSYPCDNCMRAIEASDIRTITYIAKSGHWLQDGDERTLP